MSDWWSENLLVSTLGFVEVPVADRQVSTGRHFVRTSLPYRDGQVGEDMGRKAYVFSITCPLYRGVDESYYPDNYQRLIALVEDPEQRGSLEWIDPEFGPVNVQILDYSISTPGDRRDGVMMTLQLEEVGLDTSLLENLSQQKLGGASRATLFAAQVDQEIAFIDIPDSEKPEFSLSDTWRAFQASLDAGALAADEISARMDEVYFVANKFIEFSAKDELERTSLFNSVVMYMAAAEDYANEQSDAQSTSGALIEAALPEDMSAYDIATHFHNDAGRAEEVIFNNPTSQPLLYPRGTTVRLASDAKTPSQRGGNGRAA